MHLTSLIICCLLACTPSILARKKDNAVLLSNVKSLTLRHGHSTSHRRIEAIPQLTCVGGNAEGLYNVDVMRCHNSGSEYDTEDISWTCKADLPVEFKLGSTDVICEGYDSPDDPYVLKGSCGVEYRLILTDVGEQKYRDHMNDNSWFRSQDTRDRLNGKAGGRRDALAGWIFWLIFSAIVIVIVYSILFPSRNNRGAFGNGRRRGWNTGYGGGGRGGGYDDGHDDPPPPYTPRAPPKPKSPRASSSNTSRNQQQNEGWRPGFWTGTAAGAAAGYAAGSYANWRQDQQRTRPGYSNWFGGTNTSPRDGYARPGYFGGAGAGRSAGPSNDPPAPSSSRHESTGFGGTRRR